MLRLKSCVGNVARVDGQLAMSRAFGDERLKEHISSDPDVIVQNIGMDVEFLILASEGLWKVMIYIHLYIL